MDTQNSYKIVAWPGYEYEYLALISQIFFFSLLFLWLSDAIWIQQNIRTIKVHVYEYKEQKNRLVIRYTVELIVPLIPFLVACPIAYSYMPDTPMGKSFMVIQWLPIVMTGGFVSGIVWSVLGVILLAVVFFIVPFYILPTVIKFINILAAEIKYVVLHARYVKYTGFTDDGIRFAYESNTPYSKKLKKIFKDFNGYYEKNYIDGTLNKKVMFYIVPDETVNSARRKGVQFTENSIFAVVECKFARYIKEFDEDVILEEVLNSLNESFRETESKYPEFVAGEQTKMLYRCADAFYPKESGLKRL